MMRKAQVFQQGTLAGVIEELGDQKYRFLYTDDYAGFPVSLTMPVAARVHEFEGFPPVFEGLLPEGEQLEAILRRYKIDRGDLFSLLLLVGADVVGSLTIKELR